MSQKNSLSKRLDQARKQAALREQVARIKRESTHSVISHLRADIAR